MQKFDAAGTHLQTIGKRGGKGGTFFRPKGIALDEAGNIYVSDSFLGVVQAFTPDGEVPLRLSGAGGASRRFSRPRLAWPPPAASSTSPRCFRAG